MNDKLNKIGNTEQPQEEAAVPTALKNVDQLISNIVKLTAGSFDSKKILKQEARKNAEAQKAKVKKTENTGTEKPESKTSKTQKLYRTQYNRVMKNIPDDPKATNIGQKGSLSLLKKFTKDHISWGYFKDGKIKITEFPDKEAVGLAAIIPVDYKHKFLKDEIIQLHPDPEQKMLIIRAVEVSQAWAAICIMQGLSFLRDDLTETKSHRNDRKALIRLQTRAHLLGFMAANEISGDMLLALFQQAINKINPKSVSDVFAQLKEHDQLLHLFSRIFPDEKCSSINEKKARISFCQQAILLAYAHMNFTGEEIVQAFQKYAEHYYKTVNFRRK